MVCNIHVLLNYYILIKFGVSYTTNMHDTYLSIDLDYWDCIAWNSKKSYNLINREKLFNKINKLNIPINVVWDHHNLLPLINKSNCTNIINVDFHSDLPAKGYNKLTNVRLNEGTFFLFVKFKKNKKYKWIMPYRDVGFIRTGEGRCDYYDGKDERDDPFNNKYWAYKQVQKTTNTKIDLSNVKEVGVSISPNWITMESHKFIRDYLFDKMNKTVKNKWIKYYNRYHY